MDWRPFNGWLSETNILLIALLLFGSMTVTALIGYALRRRGGAKADDGGEGYIVSAVLGLLALLMGFTFSLAVERYESRRRLVLEEANAIGTAYLRAQLLAEPHRTRMSDILRGYLDNRILLATADRADRDRLLQANDVFVTEMWVATSAAFPTIQNLDFSSTYLDAVNTVIEFDAARKAARTARVPPEVFAVLIVYLVVTAGVLGYVLKGKGGRLAAAFLLALLTLSLSLIVDIDRPMVGGILESQAPMERLRASMAATPRATYDRWREPADQQLPER